MQTPDRPYYRKEIDEVFKKVKVKLHAAAQEKGGGVALFTDCYTGKILRGGEMYDYEHVRSSEELFMLYRDRMTNEQIAEVVNCEGNVKVTTRAINQSKGKRMFEVWCTPENRIKYDISETVSAKTLLEADASIKRKAQEILS